MKITKKKSIKELKKKQSLVCLTAYTRPIAELVNEIADIILVGDSLKRVENSDAKPFDKFNPKLTNDNFGIFKGFRYFNFSQL